MHAAAVQHHDVVDDRKTETRAAFHAVLPVAAKEALEEIRLLVVRHARAVVFDDDLRRMRGPSHHCHAVTRHRDARAVLARTAECT